MANFNLSIEGLDRLNTQLDEMIAKIRKGAEKGVYRHGSSVLAKADERVPVDTGALKSTGKVTLPEWSGDSVGVTVGYGDESVSYALAVHENMNPNVKWNRPGSGPKYLENPHKEMQDELPGAIRDAVAEELG